jgi:hypothetical protein
LTGARSAPNVVTVVFNLPVTNTGQRPLRLRLQPFLFAEIGPGFQRLDYDMPPSASWAIEGPHLDVRVEIEVGNDLLLVLVEGCAVDDMRVIDRATGSAQAAVNEPPRE